MQVDKLFEPNLIEMNLADKMNPKRISNGVGVPYNMKPVCNIDREENIVVYSFDIDKITLDKLIGIMQYEVGIESVSKTGPCPESEDRSQ